MTSLPAPMNISLSLDVYCEDTGAFGQLSSLTFFVLSSQGRN